MPSHFRSRTDDHLPAFSASALEILSIFAGTNPEYVRLDVLSGAAQWPRVVDNRDRHCAGRVVDTTRNTARRGARQNGVKAAPPAQEPDWRAARPDRRVTPVTQRTSAAPSTNWRPAVNHPSTDRAARPMTRLGPTPNCQSMKTGAHSAPVCPSFRSVVDLHSGGPTLRAEGQERSKEVDQFRDAGEIYRHISLLPRRWCQNLDLRPCRALVISTRVQRLCNSRGAAGTKFSRDRTPASWCRA